MTTWEEEKEETLRIASSLLCLQHSSMLNARHFTSTLVLGIMTIRATVSLAGTIHVPADFATIQEAVDAASVGDLISVGRGSFHENIVIDKRLTILGTIIVDGDVFDDDIRTLIRAADSSKPVITIEADAVRLQALDVRGGEYGIVAQDVEAISLNLLRARYHRLDGIFLENCDSSSIDDTRVSYCGRYAVYQKGGAVTTNYFGIVKGTDINDIRGSYNVGGIRIEGAEDTVVSDCSLTYHEVAAIEDIASVRSSINQNYVSRNAIGILVSGSEDCVLGENLVFSNTDGILIEESTGSCSESIIRNNLGAGVRGSGSGWTFTENTIRGSRVIGVDWEGNACVFEANMIRSSFGDGFSLKGNENVLSGNISRNNDVGFLLKGNDNLYRHNKASRNREEGFLLTEGRRNMLSSNRSESSGADGYLVEDQIESLLKSNTAMRSGGNGFTFADTTESLNIVNGFAGFNGGYGFVDEGELNDFSNTSCNGEGNVKGGSLPAGLCD